MKYLLVAVLAIFLAGTGIFAVVQLKRQT